MTRYLLLASLFALAVLASVAAWPVVHLWHVQALVAWHQSPDHQVFHCGPALELISGFVTAPGAVLTPWTMAGADSLQVRFSDPTKLVRLIQIWFKNQVAGAFQLTSPRMHDNVKGYHGEILASHVAERWPLGFAQRLYQNDILAMKHSGSGVAGQIETGSMLIYYDDLPGANGRFIDPPTLQKRMVNLLTVKNTLVTVATGTYGNAQAINTTDDLFKANTDYALIGYMVDAGCGSVTWRSADTANLRVGGPGNPVDPFITKDWFTRLSDYLGVPLIPVFNSAAKQTITLDATQDQAAASVDVDSIFAELAPAA